MSKVLRYPIANNPYSLGDAMNWKRRVLRERMKRQAPRVMARPYGLGDVIDWQRCCLRESAKRQSASNLV